MTPFQHATASVIIACWIAFIAYWFVSAFFTKRTIRRLDGGYRLFTLVALVIVGGFLLGGFARNSAVWPYSPVVGVICDIVAILSVGLLIWARITLGRNWSGRVALKEGHELVTSGPYAYIRHPIYTGVIFLALATAVNYGRAAIFIVVPVYLIVFIWRTYAEDKLMAQTFPDAYPEYKKRTKRLIPGVW